MKKIITYGPREVDDDISWTVFCVALVGMWRPGVGNGM